MSNHVQPEPFAVGGAVAVELEGVRTDYVVRGMKCGGCVSRVSSRVGGVSGVRSVAVDLASGVLTVEAVRRDDAGVRAAVAEAGCEIVS